MVTIEEDILNFYKGIYFGKTQDKLDAAVKRAYLDFCRTIETSGIREKDWPHIKKRLFKDFKEMIESISDIKSQEEYDSWHQEICEKLCNSLAGKWLELTPGQAQKWLNMTMKYLYILGDDTGKNCFEFSHIPVDRIILEAAKRIDVYPHTKKCWSKWEYGEYIDFQKRLRETIKGEFPSRWEFKTWNEAARGIGQ